MIHEVLGKQAILQLLDTDQIRCTKSRSHQGEQSHHLLVVVGELRKKVLRSLLQSKECIMVQVAIACRL